MFCSSTDAETEARRSSRVCSLMLHHTETSQIHQPLIILLQPDLMTSQQTMKQSRCALFVRMQGPSILRLFCIWGYFALGQMLRSSVHCQCVLVSFQCLLVSCVSLSCPLCRSRLPRVIILSLLSVLGSCTLSQPVMCLLP